jgi:hypothetical protein|tara:strand:- start:1190 stop:1582 length:393 start_codon:yes stop_codon:yes gene_type:complete
MNKLQKRAFKKLLFYSRSQNDEKNGRKLSRGAFEFGVYILSSLTRDELKLGGWSQKYNSLAEIGDYFGGFFDGEPMPPNRVDEALLELSIIGLITIDRVENTFEEREKYGFSGGKEAWFLDVDLKAFVES